MDGSNKRLRLEIFTIEAAASLRQEIQSVYGTKPPGFLWDRTKVWELIRPSNAFRLGSGKHFHYLGRAKAKPLYERISSLDAGDGLFILGAKGSGKSTVMSAIVGTMIAKNKRVVYICGSRYVASPVEVLRDALLVATGSEDAHLSSARRMSDLVDWCMSQIQDPLLFIVDEWEEIEKATEVVKGNITEAVSIYHILVQVVSGNSRNRHLLFVTDQPLPTFDFDGPYTRDELSTWIAQCQLPPSNLQHLDAMTGGMPGLLKYFSDVNGELGAYLREIEQPYTSKLQMFVQKQETRSQLAGFLNLVLTGAKDVRIKDLEFTCFYRDSKKRFHFLSPHLRARAEAFIMDQQMAVERLLELDDMWSWAAVVCNPASRNAARAGWNIQSLIIAVMRYRKCMWDKLYFKHYRSYEQGCEAAVLESVTDVELEEGVFVGPVVFKEPYVDATYVKLEDKKLTSKAVQISVSTWEKKKRKKSHQFWQERVLSRWLSAGWQVAHQFVYVLPSKVKEKIEMNAVVGDLPAYMASRDDDEGDADANVAQEDEAYGYDDDINLNRVENNLVEFKTFGDIHRFLSRFDRLLQPLEQKVVEKAKLVL